MIAFRSARNDSSRKMISNFSIIFLLFWTTDLLNNVCLISWNFKWAWRSVFYRKNLVAELTFHCEKWKEINIIEKSFPLNCDTWNMRYHISVSLYATQVISKSAWFGNEYISYLLIIIFTEKINIWITYWYTSVKINIVTSSILWLKGVTCIKNLLDLLKIMSFLISLWRTLISNDATQEKILTIKSNDILCKSISFRNTKKYLDLLKHLYLHQNFKYTI